MQQEGMLYATSAYLIWGFFPIYWQQLESIPASQLIGHRIAWSFLLPCVFVLAAGRARELLAALNRYTIRTYLAAALLISVNWFTYVWAVTHGFVLEASLGLLHQPLVQRLAGRRHL